MHIKGTCHCGNISFDLSWQPGPAEIPARACGCTFCVSHGAVWTSYPTGVLAVVLHDASLVSKYSFGTRTAEFHVCARCGGVPVCTSGIEERLYAVVNVNTFSNVDRALLRSVAADFESENTDARLARRARNWIGNVRFADTK